MMRAHFDYRARIWVTNNYFDSPTRFKSGLGLVIVSNISEYYEHVHYIMASGDIIGVL